MARPNPHYGTGTFRRRVRVRAAPGHVAVELEDGNHGFRLRMWHDADRINTVELEPMRIPFNTCAEAARPLTRAVGHRLDEGAAVLRDRLVPSENCTHMHDMLVLAAAHAASHRGEEVVIRQYDMAVEDERAGVMRASVRCNGETVHEWDIANHEIVSPTPLAGRPAMRGFHAWASECFADMPLEAAIALQRAYFVAQSRRFSFEPAALNPGAADGMPHGACYSYNRGVVERALRSDGTVRDFTHTPDLLLKFLP